MQIVSVMSNDILNVWAMKYREVWSVWCVKDNPAPGSYDVARAYQQTQNKMEPRPPRTAAARRRHDSFLSSSDRFAPPRDVTSDAADPSLPGHTHKTHAWVNTELPIKFYYNFYTDVFILLVFF